MNNTPSNELVKELAEAKATLEKRIRELERELRLYRLLARLIDEALSKLSFVPASQLVQPKTTEEEELISKYSIISPENEHIADVFVYKNKIIAKMKVKFRKETSPFKRFFIDRILERLVKEDKKRISVGEITPNEAFSYEIREDDDGYVEELVIRNYKDERTLRELKRALKWTLLRVKR